MSPDFQQKPLVAGTKRRLPIYVYVEGVIEDITGWEITVTVKGGPVNVSRLAQVIDGPKGYAVMTLEPADTLAVTKRVDCAVRINAVDDQGDGPFNLLDAGTLVVKP